MAKCDICSKDVHFGIKVSHSHRRSNKMWKSNVRKVRVNQNVGGPLAVLNEYYGNYTTCPDDAQERLNILHETYVKDMKAEYNYPVLLMTQEDIELFTQYETAVRQYAERKKAEWILNGGIEKEWDSYLDEMEKLGLSKMLEIKQKYLDEYFK